MKTGGGIGLIAIGVALLSLAYTGRAQRVWAALTSGAGNEGEAAAAPGDEVAPMPDPENPPVRQAGDNPARRHPQEVPKLTILPGGKLRRA